MADENTYIYSAIYIVLYTLFKLKKWSENWLLKRQQFSHVNLISELSGEPDDFRNYLRMDEETYSLLLSLVSDTIQKQNTVMRNFISPHERLTATLRFLATGRSCTDLQYSTIISKPALSKIIPETCDAIYSALKDTYLKFPKTECEWKIIATEFEEKWQFPHCLGVVDGKHIQIVAPPGSGSYYYNYKHTFSIVLMAIVNANYEFVICDVGTNGRVSDGGIINSTKFYKNLQSETLNLPKAENPYNQRELTLERRIFNYRLSRARRTVENVFDKVVMACYVLHNFLRKRNTMTYILNSDIDVEDNELGTLTAGLRSDQNNLLDLQRGQNRRSSTEAKNVRQDFEEYFNNEVKVPWQNRIV
ncbi:unnamed protein product [Macrosiphum euphorbiae]|uniref:DDE Tnp4 domain-containing protein n=1 Tax=Macrosiphum euphorbiae TaxID=13131 RepID=A0AAV0XYB2_9HEMI|nr:unnamed protein product [Macrosiphum euphorbiae]